MENWNDAARRLHEIAKSDWAEFTRLVKGFLEEPRWRDYDWNVISPSTRDAIVEQFREAVLARPERAEVLAHRLKLDSPSDLKRKRETAREQAMIDTARRTSTAAKWSAIAAVISALATLAMVGLMWRATGAASSSPVEPVSERVRDVAPVSP